MNNRLQQPLVTEYDGCVATILYAVGVEPLAYVSCLNILSGGRDVIDMLRWNLIGILIEYGFALLFKSAEESLLNLLQKVETNKHIGVVFELNAFIGSNLAIEGTFVGQLLLGKLGVKLMINLANMAP